MKPWAVCLVIAINVASVGTWLYARAKPEAPVEEDFGFVPFDDSSYQAGLAEGRKQAREEISAVLRDAKLNCECR